MGDIRAWVRDAGIAGVRGIDVSRRHQRRFKNWGSGFLPTIFQGVPFRRPETRSCRFPTRAASPAKSSADARHAEGDQRTPLRSAGDPEIATRINSFEMAYRMQESAPDLMDFSKETKATLEHLRRGARQEHLRQQLPARAAPDRTRRALRSALSRGLGSSQRGRIRASRCSQRRPIRPRRCC